MQLYVKETNSILRRTQKEIPGVGMLTYVLCEERGLKNQPTEYGIGIYKTSPGGEEERYIPSVTTDRFFAVRLYRAVVLGQVTPCTLTDVVLDLLSEV